MKSARIIYLFVAGVIIIPVTVFGITKWYGSRFQRLPVLGPEKHIVGNFRFRDQKGEEITQKNWTGEIIVANYFFTSCPSICPKLMAGLQKVQALGSKYISINSFTVDPERDSVGRLKKYADKNGIRDHWLLLTGDKISLYKFARTDLLIDATDGDGGPGDFIHSDKLVLIDPKMQIRGFYNGTEESELDRLIRDIDKLKIEFKL